VIYEILSQLEQDLGFQIEKYKAVHGGDINQAYQLSLYSGDSYFLKYNLSPDHEDIIRSEHEALILFEENKINAPKVVEYASFEDYSYLLMEFIDGTNRWTPKASKAFVNVLKKLHSIKHDKFGFHSNNRIGTLLQPNKWYDNFADYFWDSRIAYQIDIAYSQSYLQASDKYRDIYRMLQDFPKYKPCLIHGDLWSGNHIISSSAESYLIDPSISYGIPEIDLAMMQLFGGFPQEVLESYSEITGLKTGWKERLSIYQLYYLLVHLNLFCSSYLGRVMNILKKYS
jgi:fructosamine-3-kinase